MNKKAPGIIIAIVIITALTVAIGAALSLKNRLVTSVPLLNGEADHFVIPLTIKGKEYTFFVDTGGPKSMITQRVANELALNTTGVTRKNVHIALKESKIAPETEKIYVK